VATRWLDLVDPTSEEILAAVPVQVDPDVVAALAAPAAVDREARPLVESHGAYVFGVLTATLPVPDHRVVLQEVGIVATPELLVTVRKTPHDGPAFDASVLRPASEEGCGSGSSSSA
jgi:Mg2+ and Co2+ transporter CorA